MLDDDAEIIALDAPQPTAPEVRTRHSKVSAALAPKLYYGLVDFCAAASRTTGSRVTHVEVLRTLVAELMDSEQLRTHVLAQLRRR
jgi:hypothetical protein